MKTILFATLSLVTGTVAAHPGEAVTPGNRPAYCRGEVSGQYGTKPMYVKTEKLVKEKDGSTSISGTVDKGSEGTVKFKCRFDAQGKFVDVMAMTSDGE